MSLREVQGRRLRDREEAEAEWLVVFGHKDRGQIRVREESGVLLQRWSCRKERVR